MNTSKVLRVAAALLVVAAAVELPVAYYFNFQYDNLRPRGQIPPRITGTFIQYTGLATWNYTMWDAELAELEALGLDTVIIQWTHGAATNKTLYRSALYDFDSASVGAGMTVANASYPNHDQPDMLNVFFDLAEKHGLRVHVGLSADWTFWWQMDNATWLDAEVAEAKALASEILGRYKHLPSLAGVYIPYEDIFGSDAGAPEGTRYGEFLARIAGAVKEAELAATGGHRLQVSVAPACAPSWYWQVRSYVDALLAAAGIDVLMVQDSVGAKRCKPLDDLPPVYAAVADSCAAAGVEFWTDLEIFDIDTWLPCTMSRLATQLDVECRYAGKVVVFDVPHYLSEQYSASARALHDAYEAYLASGL
ncbi:MAG: DUF4434 domain-containing protein [Candidatus Lokiarchaeota archaeon]|nr:DUF4434 domain-containing protein [Candidatus Lokiarchaeota archaeon]